MAKLGPGTLKIGATAAEIDLSCAVNSMTITVDKDESDGKTMLCGTVKPGKTTYTYKLQGNIDTDSEDPEGFFALAAAAPGSIQPFEFTPSSAGGTVAKGNLVIDPLDFGGEEYGEDLASDIEFTLVGAPVYTYPAPAGGGGRIARLTSAASSVPEAFRHVIINGDQRRAAELDHQADQDEQGAEPEQDDEQDEQASPAPVTTSGV